MLFCKTINNYCKDVVLNDPHIFSINKCCNYTNLDATIHVLTPKSAGHDGQCESRTKNAFFFEKNVVDRTTFAGRPTELARPIVHASFILDLPYLAHISSLGLA